jgi:2-polyprenyl-6-methoxyphenol hydroxylase-like FAD-dependent oxidoreductase
VTSRLLRVAIAGGGVGGLAAAVALRARGHRVRVYERRAKPETGTGAMLLWPNGFAALDAIGLGDRLRAGTTEIEHIDFRTELGRNLARWDVGCAPRVTGIRLVYRARLLGALLASIPADSIQFGSAVAGFRLYGGGVEVLFEGGGKEHADLLVLCDGVHSRLRAQLFGQPAPATVSQVIWFGTVDYGDDGKLPAGLAVGTTGDGRRFCAARVDRQRVFWYATVNAARRPSRAGAEALAAVFAQWHAPIQDLIRAAPDEEIIPIALTDSPPLRRWGRGHITLLGDSAHACLPDMGQGAGLALESAVGLAERIASGEPLEAALRNWEARRRVEVGEAIRMSRAVAVWSMSEAVHVSALRNLLATQVLPVIGFPLISRWARAGASGSGRRRLDRFNEAGGQLINQ